MRERSSNDKAQLEGTHAQSMKRAHEHAPTQSSVLRMLGVERRLLVRVFESLLPARVDARLSLGAEHVPMAAFVDDLLASAPLKSVLGIRLSLWIILLSPMLILGRFRGFFSLRDTARIALLKRLQHSDVYVLRESVFLMKTICSLGYCGLAKVQTELGIAPVDQSLPAWATEISGTQVDRFVQVPDANGTERDRIVQVRHRNSRQADSTKETNLEEQERRS